MANRTWFESTVLSVSIPDGPRHKCVQTSVLVFNKSSCEVRSLTVHFHFCECVAALCSTTLHGIHIQVVLRLCHAGMACAFVTTAFGLAGEGFWQLTF